MPELFVGQSLLQVPRAGAAVDDHVVVSFRDATNGRPQELLRLFCVDGGRVEGAEVLLLQRVVEPVHEVLEADVAFTLVRQDPVSEDAGPADFPYCSVKTRFVAEEVLLPGFGPQAVKLPGPADDAVLVYVDLRPPALLQRLDQPLGIGMLRPAELLGAGAAGEACVVL